MSILIDKSELMRHIENEMREWGEEYDALQVLGDIEDFPTADAVVGVIKCKDCRYADNEPDRDGSDVWICNYNHWRRAEGIRCPDGFCSEGDRREE